MYEIAICDDSRADAESLKRSIQRCVKCRFDIRFHEYTSGKQLLSAMENIQFAIIFLDICMDEMDGEETAEELRKINDNVILVFFSGYAEPSVHSIRMQPYRFIKKNMSADEINSNLEEILQRMAVTIKEPVLDVKISRKQIKLRLDEIVYIDKYKKYIRVHITERAIKKHHISITDGKEPDIRITAKLEKIYQFLKPHGFGYPHDSYIINFNYVVSAFKNEICLEGYEDMVFRVTRSKAVEFNRLKREFYGKKYKNGF